MVVAVVVVGWVVRTATRGASGFVFERKSGLGEDNGSLRRLEEATVDGSVTLN